MEETLGLASAALEETVVGPALLSSAALGLQAPLLAPALGLVVWSIIGAVGVSSTALFSCHCSQRSERAPRRLEVPTTS